MKSLLEEYLHRKIQVVIDRPLGSKHPDFETLYTINYGYLPNTKAPNGEEIDVYVLGVDKPIEKFDGRVIAIIHRLDNKDDKLVVAREGRDFSKDEIRNLTNFQEKYFKSEIIK